MQTAAEVSPLRRKLLWLLGLRVATVTIVLGTGLLAQIRYPGVWPIDPFFILIGVTYGLTVVYGLTLKLAERQRWIIDFQLAGDALTVTGMVLLTGGVVSFYSTLYALPIVGASVLQFRRGGLLVGVMSTLMYGGLVVAQYTGVFGFFDASWLSPPDLPPIGVAAYTAALDAFGFMGVAWLSGSLAERLRSVDASLAQASTEIADLQAFNEHVIESLTSGLATTDQEGRVLTFNRAAQVITGRRADAAVGLRIGEVLQLAPSFEQALYNGFEGSLRTELMYTTPNGRKIDVGLNASPLMTPGGRSGFLIVFQDVTEARRLEREARLQQRLAAVGEMAAGIAHEIRNPLASMSGSIQILRQELPLNEEQAQLMDIVLRESERLNETIKTFLAYARPQRFSTTRLDLRRVISDAALLLKHSSESSDRHRVDIDLPAEPVWFDADENQIRQIVWNLATNGLRAMPEGGRLCLSVRHGMQQDVVLSVTDEGVGIPIEELDRVLQPFHGGFQKGTGLGLAIVHRIVNDYGGEMEITSEEGVGTSVTIHFPLRRTVSESAAKRGYVPLAV